jgi:hypothetical protein
VEQDLPFAWLHLRLRLDFEAAEPWDGARYVGKGVSNGLRASLGVPLIRKSPAASVDHDFEILQICLKMVGSRLLIAHKHLQRKKGWCHCVVLELSIPMRLAMFVS